MSLLKSRPKCSQTNFLYITGKGKVAQTFALLLRFLKHCSKQAVTQFASENSPTLVTMFRNKNEKPFFSNVDFDVENECR
jgi:hypothetical protein